MTWVKAIPDGGPMETGDVLRGCGFFSRVDAPRLARLSRMAVKKRFDKGEIVFREGDPCPGLYVVGSGGVRIYKVAASGKEHVLHLVAPGQVFAEAAVIGGFDCPACAEALEPTECALLPADRFRALIAEDHPLCLQIMASLAHLTHHLVDLLEDIVLRDAASRVGRHLLNARAGVSGDVTLPTLKKHLASHLNLTSETLSRSLRRLEAAGLIALDRKGRVRVRDAEGLAALAEGRSPRI